MSTPSIQTLITQAQQVLNLKSSNEIRATLAAVLANANVGTPLNPNLTTQQLWDEFYEIVRQPSDDIMSIITDQMMRMVFSPPAPGGAGADKQVIFNDGGVLAGDPDLIFNKALNKLVANNIETAAGLLVGTSATITGDLTVDTSTLKVDSTNNRVIVGHTSGSSAFQVTNAGAAGLEIQPTGFSSAPLIQSYNRSGSAYTQLTLDASTIVHALSGTTAMTLNSTGLGIGVTPGSAIGNLQVGGSTNANLYTQQGTDTIRIGVRASGRTGIILDSSNATYTNRAWYLDNAGSSGSLTIGRQGLDVITFDNVGNVGIGVAPSAWISSWKAIDINTAGAGLSGTAAITNITNNCFLNASAQWVYKGSFVASRYQQSAGEHQFYSAVAGTGGVAIGTFTQAMTLDASGNLLVGVTSASNQERLNVSSAVSLYVARVFNTASSGGNYGIAIRYSNAAPNNGSNEFLACSDSAASRAFIYSNGGIANYQANDSNLSDARTKTDIKPLTSYWNKIKALELVTFKYKDQTHNDDNIGLISQQVESVAPEFVSNDGFGETPADGIPLKAIYTTDLYHAAIKALQEAMTRIEALEAKLA